MRSGYVFVNPNPSLWLLRTLWRRNVQWRRRGLLHALRGGLVQSKRGQQPLSALRGGYLCAEWQQRVCIVSAWQVQRVLFGPILRTLPRRHIFHAAKV